MPSNILTLATLESTLGLTMRILKAMLLLRLITLVTGNRIDLTPLQLYRSLSKKLSYSRSSRTSVHKTTRAFR